MCAFKWQSRDDFIEDPSLEINGYLADLEELKYSQFYFTHNVAGCGSTMVIEARDFFSLYSGPSYKERRTDQEDCPGYCRDKEQLDRCAAYCECAFNREIIQLIRARQSLNKQQTDQHKKKSQGSSS